MDISVLRYTADWCRHFGADKIYFANVQKTLEVPEKYRSYLLDVDKPLDEKLREDLESRILTYFPACQECDYELDVIEGNPRDQLTHWIKVKGIDLLITGRKAEPHGRGILPQQLLRNSKCSVLFVPPDKPFSFRNIGLPVKLGSQEDIHLKVAMDWVEEGGVITCQHFYSIPSSYNHMITTTGMLLEGMKESARTGAQRPGKRVPDRRKGFRAPPHSQVDRGIQPLGCHPEVQRGKTGVTFIMMLSGGKSKIQTFLIGSETEAMVKKNKDFPLLILK